MHLEVSITDLPVRYRLLRLIAPDELRVERVTVDELPKDWGARPEETRRIGDAWLAAGRSPLLAVPSALAAESFNVLLNPRHQEAGRVRIAQVSEHPIDPRLLAR